MLLSELVLRVLDARPYELHRLNEIDEEYEAVGKSDSRLTEEREGGGAVGA